MTRGESIRTKLARWLPPQSLQERLVRGTIWSFIGTMMAQVLGLGAAIIVARLLEKIQFGELGVIQSTVGMFAVFGGMGLGLTATKYVAQFRMTDAARAGRVMELSQRVAFCSGAVAAGVLAWLAPYLAAKTLNAGHLGTELRLSSGLLFFGALDGAQTGALAGLEAFKTLAKTNLIRGMLYFPIMLAGAYFWGLRGAVGGLVVTTGIGWAINYVALRWESRKAGITMGGRGMGREWPILWKFSLPAFLSGAMVGPVAWVANTMLVNQPNGYADMGIYTAANQWFMALTFVPVILGQVVLPVLSERLGQADHLRSVKILEVALKLNAAVLVPVIVVGSLASGWIMGFYGPGFKGSGLVLTAVLLTSGLFALLSPLGHMIIASGRMWIGLAINAGWGAVFLILATGMVRWGAMGLASARLLAYVAHTIWTVWIVYALVRKTPIESRSGKNGRS